MKRRELVDYLYDMGCYLLREGSNHTIFYNPESKRTAAIPRHNEIRDTLARKICKQLDIPPIK